MPIFAANRRFVDFLPHFDCALFPVFSQANGCFGPIFA
jgi:hypothetical protein